MPDAKRRKTVDIEIPKGFYNVAISSGVLVADTNDSQNWDTIRLPLPRGNWRLKKKIGKKLTLVKHARSKTQTNRTCL